MMMERTSPGEPDQGGAGLPAIDLRQVQVLNDDTGILQHAAYGVPDLHHGYCTDDNARSLIAAVYAARLGDDSLQLAHQRNLAFLHYAFNPATGRFRNFMGYDRRWLEEVGSEDSHGRAVWGLGMAVRHAPSDSTRDLAARLLRQAAPATEGFESIRAWAFAVIGLEARLSAFPGDALAAGVRNTLAVRLFEVWQRKAEPSDGWPWWEDVVTYANAKLPHALVVSGASMGRGDMLETGLATLRWLIDIQTAEDGHVSFIGNQGWLARAGVRARFDQQPLEAHGLVHACLAAASVTGDEVRTRDAERAFGWFTGRNDLGLSLHNPESGGCHDGLMAGGVNRNEGAESTLAYVLSLLELHLHSREIGPAG
ncbi:MAG: hypothetical protein ACYS9X_05105 [Planctomycetota bacterium]